MKKIKIAIFISGRGTNMDAILKNCRDGILQDCCSPELVLSNKAEAGGLQIAKEAGVPVSVILSKGKGREEFEKEVINEIEKFQVDYIVLAGFNRILSPFFIKKFENRIINIHPADTLAFQGLHGYEWAFTNKLPKTKITVHYVDEGVDTGKIILQRDVDLTGTSTLEEVECRGLEIENVFFSEALAFLFNSIIEQNS